MKYVLDTNAVSALMKGEGKLVRQLQRLAPTDVAIPHPVMAEIAYGIARLPRSKRRDRLREKLALIATEIGRCAWTDDVDAAFGTIKAKLEMAGTRIEDFDAAIAAHALAYGAVLVTANSKHMARVDGLAIEDWCK